MDGVADDPEPAVVDLDGDIAVVLGGDDEVNLGQTHHVLAHVGALGFGLAAVGQCNVELRVGDRLPCCVFGFVGIALDLLLGAVILDRFVIAGDGDGDLVGDRIDLQPAVDNLDFDVAVVVRGGFKVGCLQAHLVFTSIGARGFGLVAGLQGDGDGLGADIRRVAGHGLLGAVIRDGICSAGDFDDDLGIVCHDGQFAEFGRDLVVGSDVVAVLILDLCHAGEHAVIVTNGCALREVGQAGERMAVGQGLAGLLGDAGDTLLLAVIRYGLALADEGQLQRGNGQLAGGGCGDDVLSVGADLVDRAVAECDIVLAHIRAGAGGGDSFEGNAFRCAGIAGHRLLGAVIDLAVAVRGQGDVLVVIEVDDIRAGADGQVLAVIADCGITLNGNRRFRDRGIEGLVVNRLGFRDFIRRGVPVIVDRVAEVGALGVGDGLGDIIARHRAAHGGPVRSIAVDGRRGHIVCRIDRKALGMAIMSRCTIRENVVDRQLEGVLDVVYLDDVGRFVRADGQRDGIMIKLIAGRALVGIGCDLSFILSRKSFGQRVVLRAVDVVFDGVSVGVDLPDGVEVVCGVCVDVVDDCGIAFGVGVTSAVCFRVPAAEGVTLARSHARCSITKNGDQTVVGNLIDGVLCIICAEVAVVGQADGAGLVAEHGVEGGIVDHFDGRAGFVGHVAVRGCRPAEEDLPCGDTRIAVHNDRVGVLCVVLGIDNGSRITANIIGQLITGLAADLGIQVITIADLGIEVERRAAQQRPAVELLSFSDGHGRSILFVDLRAVRDVLNLFQRVCGCFILPEGHDMDRGDPLGMEGDVLRRHGLAGEVIRVALAQLVVVPAVEDIAVHARGRGGGCVGFAGDIRSELDVLVLYVLGAADENKVIAVAVIIELRFVVIFAVFRTVFGVAGKASDRVAVFTSYCRSRRSIILMIQLVVLSAYLCVTTFTRQNLEVIGCGRTVIVTLFIEVLSVQRHSINVRLPCGAIRTDMPSAARPLLADVRAVLGCDA